MPRISFVKLLSVLVLTLGAWLASASAAITYEVGTCKPHFPTYSSISAALAATTPPDVVMICPGTYTEQIEITLPVTLEGVSVGDSAQVIIEPPSGGLITNTSDDFGVPVAAQVWVNNVTGPVNITDITLDATGNAGTNQEIIGIYYQNSSGTINRVASRNQQGNTLGAGIWVQGGAANPSVLIENSSIHDFDFAGIVAVTDAGSSQLTATVKGNNVKVSTTSSFTEGIVLRSGATTIVSNNFVSGETFGIASELGAAGSISGNTLIDNNQDGIVAGADAVPVTSNKILNAVNNGIVLRTSAALIQGNSILNTPFAINFDCQANANVHSNTISDAGTALAFLPPGLTTLSNSYFNVSTIRSTSLCGPD
jgi:hypothetical protein